MLQFKKEDLEFLVFYDLFKSTKQVYYDKFYIRKVNEKVIFIGILDDISIYTIIDVDQDVDDFWAVLPVDKVYKMLKFCSDDEIITFTEDSINFGKKSSYKFENYSSIQSIYNVDTLFDIIDNISNYKEIEIKDISKLNYIIRNKGKDEFDIFSYQSQHYVLNNGSYLTSVNKAESIVDNIWFPAKLQKFLNIIDAEDINILSDGKRYLYKLDNTYLDFSIPDKPPLFDIFDSEMQKYYEHKNKISFDKVGLKDAINRLAIVSEGIKESKASVIFNNEGVLFKNLSGIEGQELIDINFPKILVGQYINLSPVGLSKVIDLLDGDIITLFLPDKLSEASVIKIIGEDNNLFFILNLMSD